MNCSCLAVKTPVQQIALGMFICGSPLSCNIGAMM